jgi:hypothetical protein
MDPLQRPEVEGFFATTNQCVTIGDELERASSGVFAMHGALV